MEKLKNVFVRSAQEEACGTWITGVFSHLVRNRFCFIKRAQMNIFLEGGTEWKYQLGWYISC